MVNVSNRQRFWRPLFLLIVVLCIASLGCGKTTPMGTVAGTVTLDDKPYADSALMFIDLSTGQAGTADIQSDGTFAMAGPIQVGTYTVFLSPKTADNESMEATPMEMGGELPQKYYSEAESDITIVVAEGENTVKVELKSGG